MQLIFTKNSPINTTLVSNDGHILYKIDTPFALGKRTTTINKFAPNKFSEKGETDSMLTLADGVDIGKDSKSAEFELRDKSTHLAEIEWYNISGNKLRIGGVEQAATSFLKPSGFASQHRLFTAPDGRPYKWNMGSCGMKNPILEVNESDGSWKCVAKFRRRHLGILKKAQKAHVEIYPEGQHLIDTIIITFVYCDHVRRKKIAAARAAAIAGGS